MSAIFYAIYLKTIFILSLKVLEEYLNYATDQSHTKLLQVG